MTNQSKKWAGNSSIDSADAWRLNIDLHCHSTYSDGVLAPDELIRRAADNGVQAIALTDHDETAGLTDAAETARDCGVTFIPGVEISVSWAGKTIHIVGLGIDPANSALSEGLASVRNGRDQRARDMGDALSAAGVSGAYDGARALATNPALVSRTHFARYLVNRGVCVHVNEVFQRFLVPGRPGYVPHQWATLRDAVGWITGAGGEAVIAHPGRYRLDDTELWALMSEFREAGGHTIEVVTGSHTRDQYQRFARIAIEHDFCGSRGSDFHSPEESRVDLGELPPLPDNVVPVWMERLPVNL